MMRGRFGRFFNVTRIFSLPCIAVFAGITVCHRSPHWASRGQPYERPTQAKWGSGNRRCHFCRILELCALLFFPEGKKGSRSIEQVYYAVVKCARTGGRQASSDRHHLNVIVVCAMTFCPCGTVGVPICARLP